VNAGCAALSYYTDMLFRSCAIVLIAGSVLITGCRAPRSGDAAASRQTSTATDARSSGDSANQSAGPSAVSKSDFQSDSDIQSAIDAHAHYATGIIHEMNLDPESALDEYYKAAMLDPTNQTLVIDVSQEFLQARRPEKALEILQNSATNSAGSSGLFAEMGFVYSKLGKTNEAIAADRAAIRKDPTSLSGYQSLFLDYSQNKRITEIWDLLNEASKVKGTDADFLVGLGELYVTLGRQVPEQKEKAYARAVTALQRATKFKITEPRTKLRLADGLNIVGKTDDATRYYEELLKELPSDSPQLDPIHEKLANIYIHNNDTKQATEHLQAIVRDNPTDSQTYYALGSLAYDETNYLRATEYFANAILFNPDFDSAYYNLATAQLGANRASEALQTLERARRRFGQNFSIEYLSGMAFSQQKDYTNALQHYTTAEIIGKNSNTNRLTEGFYFQLAAAYERTGDYTQAEKYFKDSLQLAPDSPETLNYLGYMWAEHGMKLDQARDYIAKALKTEPKNAAYLDSMAWVLFQLHQPKPALDYALKALQNSEEEDATLYDHLGDIYNALGQKDKARQAWNKSLSLETNDVVRKKVESAGK
jgi:tetratricopeptide (TPR) repeat protein